MARLALSTNLHVYSMRAPFDWLKHEMMVTMTIYSAITVFISALFAAAESLRINRESDWRSLCRQVVRHHLYSAQVCQSAPGELRHLQENNTGRWLGSLAVLQVKDYDEVVWLLIIPSDCIYRDPWLLTNFSRDEIDASSLWNSFFPLFLNIFMSSCESVSTRGNFEYLESCRRFLIYPVDSSRVILRIAALPIVNHRAIKGRGDNFGDEYRCNRRHNRLANYLLVKNCKRRYESLLWTSLRRAYGHDWAMGST